MGILPMIHPAGAGEARATSTGNNSMDSISFTIPSML
jgi:hypothetical protein